MSHYSRDEMVRLARTRGGNPDDPHRRDPLDFVLWQPSLPDEPAWRAPFGVGRPGWHVECSVMAMNELGPTIDLHGGGTDLIFPHHECEVAQSESITGQPFSRHWVHSAMVSYEGEKMSKSLGNLVFVSDLLKTADPRAIRLALMQHHYRAGFEWHDTDLDDGTALLHRLLAAAERPTAPTRARSPSGSAPPSTTTSTPRARSRRSTTSPARCSRVASDPTAPETLRELGALLGIDLDRRPARHAPAITDESVRGPTGNVGGPCTITITLPDGSTRDYEQGVTAGEVAASIGRGLAKAALAAKVTEDGGAAEWYDLDRPIEHDAALAIVTPDTSRGGRCCATRPRT